MNEHIQAAIPKLERYMGLARQIKEKTRERKNLLAEKKETPFYQIPKLRDLTRRIAELTEELEELKTEKEMLLRSLDCADDTGISAVKKETATLEGALQNVAKMLKAIHAQESKKAAREKAKAVAADLRAMKLPEAAKKVESGIEETLTYCDFPTEHWTKIRTNNAIERLNREIRRRTRVVGAFPDGNSALMLVCARLRHVAGTQWGCKKYMNMKHLEALEQDQAVG